MHRALLRLKLLALTFSITTLFLGLPVSGMAFDVGPLSIGGAMRTNYYFGDYTDPQGFRAEPPIALRGRRWHHRTGHFPDQSGPCPGPLGGKG